MIIVMLQLILCLKIYYNYYSIILHGSVTIRFFLIRDKSKAKTLVKINFILSFFF